MLFWVSRRLSLSWLAVCLAGSLGRGCLGGSLPAQKVETIERVISFAMARQKIPGLTVAVGGGTIASWSKGFGLADLENSVPATTETEYRIASISKPITAVAALQLAQAGRLDLDAPIQKYVPSFPKKPWPITARELLAHTSGIRHYRSVEEVDSTRHYMSLVDALKIFAGDPLEFEPGTRFLYSTYGYNLLGAAVEQACGRPFLEYLRANVFEPARMDHIRLDDIYAVIPHRARGYVLALDGALSNCALSDNSNKLPGGGFLATAEDLIRFAMALQRGVLLKPEARSMMFSRQKTRDGKPTCYGLGWSIIERGGSRWLGHSGGQPGATTFLLLDPEGGTSVAVLANLEGINLQPLAQVIAEVAGN